MKVSDEAITEIVSQVIQQMADNGRISPKDPGEIQPVDGVCVSVDEAVAQAKIAQKHWSLLKLDHRHRVVAAMRAAAHKNLEAFARLAVAETGFGRVEDKISKNRLVADKTPGPEDVQPECFTGDRGLTLVERAPYGVICAITPSTNCTETIINNGISMVSGGNAVVFGIHPMARKVTLHAMQVLNRAIVGAGGPPGLLSSFLEPSMENSQKLMRHKDIHLVVVTGGPGVVKEAFKSGKKVMAAGPGNPPVVVDETADLPAAAKAIIAGATLDNNIVCIAEKEIIAVASIADALRRELRNAGAIEIGAADLFKLEKLLLTKEGEINKKFVGKNASVILEEIGIRVADSTRLIFTEVEASHPFVQHEQLMPVLPLVRVPDIDTAIEVAVDVEHGFRHTFTMHSRNIDHLHRMAVAVNCSIFVKNGPSYAGLGLGGEGFTSMTICSPTGEGLTRARTFTRLRRCVVVDHFRIV